jgi:hypothetical protein
MSVFTRMKRIQDAEDQGELSTLTSKSQTLVLADQPTIARLRAVLAELSGFVGSKGTAKQKRMLFVVNRMANDICEELQDADQETLSSYFAQMGQVISWIGTGSYDGMTEIMREWIRPRAEAIAELTPDPEFGDFVEEELVATYSGSNNGMPRADTWTR